MSFRIYLLIVSKFQLYLLSVKCISLLFVSKIYLSPNINHIACCHLKLACQFILSSPHLLYCNLNHHCCTLTQSVNAVHFYSVFVCFLTIDKGLCEVKNTVELSYVSTICQETSLLFISKNYPLFIPILQNKLSFV